MAELRRGGGLTQSVLAERASVTVRYIQALEAGRINPTFTTLLALAGGLDVAPAALFLPPKSTAPAARGRPPGVIETAKRRRVSRGGSARRASAKAAR